MRTRYSALYSLGVLAPACLAACAKTAGTASTTDHTQTPLSTGTSQVQGPGELSAISHPTGF